MDRAWQYVCEHCTPVKICTCVLLLTLSWAVWDMDRAAHRETAALNASVADATKAELKEVNGVVEQHSQKLDQIESAATTAVNNFSEQSDALLQQGTRAVVKVNGTLDTVNRSCGVKIDGKMLPCGTLADVAQTLEAYRRTGVLINVAMKHENDQLGNVDDAVAKFDALLGTTTGTVSDVDKFVTSRDLFGAVKNLNATTGQFALMSTDAQTKFHAFLFPPPCRGWKCRIGQTINDVRIGSQFIEPAFYLRQLLTGEEISGTVTVKTQTTQKTTGATR